MQDEIGKKEILEKLAKTVMDGDEERAKKAAEEALKAKIDPVSAIKDGLTKGIKIVGEKFHNFEIFLPEVILAADAMKAAMAVLKPHIAAERANEVMRGKAVIGTVRGDIHDIGKNLVAAMLEVSGYEVHDMGTDCPSTKFIEKAKEVGADIIGMSSLMVTSMCYQKDVIDYLKDMNERNKYWIMVGGGPVTPQWTIEIGADGYGRFSDDAVEVANTLMEKGSEIKLPVIKE